MTDSNNENWGIFEKIQEKQRKRAEEMPTEQDAIDTIQRAYHRLMELGWNDAVYCPKDGSNFKAIEGGSRGVFDCCYIGKWPKGSWWLIDGQDIYPSRPILYKLTDDSEQKRKKRFADGVKKMKNDGEI